MTDPADQVLASIDETLDGYIAWDPHTSPDAMRWRPDGPAKPRGYSPGRAYLAPAGALADGPDAWTELGHVADGGFVHEERDQADHAEAVRRFNDQLTVTVRVNFDAMRAAFASLAGAVKRAGVVFGEVARRNHPTVARLQYGEDYRRHRRACRICNPAGNPKPLKVNGAEYRRRTRARRRRNRR
jgi:hypothetical protein